MWNQPDRLRGPDSASFEGTEIDPSDSSDIAGHGGPRFSVAGGAEGDGPRFSVAAPAEPHGPRPPVAVTGQPEALGADSMDEDGIDGQPLSEDEYESVERGSSVDEENEEFEKKRVDHEDG